MESKRIFPLPGGRFEERYIDRGRAYARARGHHVLNGEGVRIGRKRGAILNVDDLGQANAR